MQDPGRISTGVSWENLNGVSSPGCLVCLSRVSRTSPVETKFRMYQGRCASRAGVDDGTAIITLVNRTASAGGETWKQQRSRMVESNW